MRLTASLLLTVLASGAPAIAAEARVPLVSHRALYELRLGEATGNRAPASAEGMIAYHFSSDCDFYAQSLRQVVAMQPQEGRAQLSESRVSTYEDGRGQDFRFTTVESGARGEEVEGRAQRASDGALAIALSSPRPQKISADSAVLFPTQHIAKLIDAAEKGENILLARVFDGSADGRKIFNVTAVIGAARTTPDADSAAKAEKLRGLRRWPVSLAYFPEDRHDGAPDYVLNYDLYENGVSTHLKLDYGDYSLNGELTRIEFPARTLCRK
ncbi:DUF1849 family protein [Rhodoblastus acidophilus]|uniref:DUF1849 family protein n=1 Tax=Rhodoblastus acidophilus TaxID=1074 RepID=A0A6N8DRD7_RHOAC|nr:cell envelope integrity EipB family protein [Rhodoblastus acidophilus]MCW2276205.1 hypothetical protein [Rhodoblastus acidophilus]MTV32868.1 DUF1849 family protein [Rhodoblastus acidophilus]